MTHANQSLAKRVSGPFDEMPQILGRYEIVDRLAVGGMGELYLARDEPAPGSFRYVVIKSLLPQLARNEDDVQAFLDEGQIATRLNHPNIVSTLEVRRWEGVYFLVMEYIDGPNLAELLVDVTKDGGRLAPDVAARIVSDAARALSYAHGTDATGEALSVIHRDLSPHNIMVRRDGIAKLVDFGIAKFKERASRTSTGLVKGKVTYMSPEQLRSEELTAATDQYSLGIVFWELLTATRLFPLQSNGLPAPRPERVEPPSQLAPMPSGLDEIVQRMLALSPAARFRDCGEVVSALEPFASDYDSVSRAVRAVAKPLERASSSNSALWHIAQQTPERDTRTRRLVTDVETEERATRRPWSVSIIAIAGALLLGLGGAAILRGGDSAVAEETANRTVVLPAVELDAPKEEEQATTEAAKPVPSPPLARDLTPAKARLEDESSRPARRRVDGVKEPRRARIKRKDGPTTGVLTITTTPWTVVWIDGKRRGLTPLVDVELSTGAHEVRFVNEEKNIDVVKTVRVKPGAQRAVFELN